MKHLLPQWQDKLSIKAILPLLLFSMMALGIWFIGPFIGINQYYPLDDTNKRLYTISALFFLWMLRIIFVTNKTPEISAPTSANPEFIKKLRVLEARISGATDFLKKTLITKHGKELSLFSLPWYFVIGPTQGGKTSLLANANINYILSKQFKLDALQALPATDTCDWWVTRDAVLVDVPSSYINSYKKNNATTTNTYSLLWKNLLHFTNKFRSPDNIEGVILTLPLTELLSTQHQSNREQLIHDLKNALHDIYQAFEKNVACYIVVTKCDKLPGFIEFFGDASSEELNQAWGVTFSATIQPEALLENFTQRFSALIKRLNKQLIWRLHQERNPANRPYIKDFPLQVERLHEVLTDIIKGLQSSGALHLQGVYLTSALQPSIDTTANTLPASSHTASSQQALLQVHPPTSASRAFFIKQFILHGFAPAQHQTLVTKKSWRNAPATAYGLSAAVLLFSLALLGNDFHNSVTQTYAIKNSLAQYKVVLEQHSSTLEQKLRVGLPLMDALHVAATKNTHVLIDYTDKAQVTAQAAYQQGLRTLILPAIQNVFESYLTVTSNKTPDELYAVLKAYLMLNEPQHTQRDYIAYMFEKISASTLPPAQSQQLLQHLNIMLESKWQPLALNNELIGRVRLQLGALPPTQLSYVILKSISGAENNQTIKLGLNFQNVFALTDPRAENIPEMYTADVFEKINNNMTQATREAQLGNWVMGDLNNDSALASLDDLRKLYVTNYVAVWEKLLNQIHIKTPQNKGEMNERFARLAGDSSPLLQLLQIVKQNTAFSAIQSASPTLTQINNLFTNNPNGTSLIQISQSLLSTHNLFQTLLHDEKSAFNLTLKRIKNPATSDALTGLLQQAMLSPEPVRGLLKTIADQSWHLIFTDAQHYLTTQWHETIGQHIPLLAARFPLSIRAPQEITFDDFSKIYGFYGAFPLFYRDNLQAFIDTSGSSWVWKKYANEQLTFDQAVLNKIQKALQTQQVLYPHNDNQLLVQFSLKPLTPEGYVKNFHLTVNGQDVQYEHANKGYNLTWPGNQKTQQTLLSIITKNNKIYKGTVQGDWGLFRMVMETIQKSLNPQDVLLNLALDGYKAKFILSSQAPINPFLYNNLQNLVLPVDLT